MKVLFLLGTLVACFSVSPPIYQSVPTVLNPGQVGTSLTPQIAVDLNGNALIVYENPSNEIYASFRPKGRGWQSPERISAVGESAAVPQVAFDSEGNAVAVWKEIAAPNFSMQAAFRTPGSGGAWSAAERIAPLLAAEFFAQAPDLAIDSEGNALVVWESNGLIQASFRTPGSSGAWAPVGSVATLSATGASFPKIALDSSGNALAVWKRGELIEASFRTPGSSGTWIEPGSVATLSAPGESAFRPQVAVDSADNGIAVWYRDNLIESSFRTPGSSGVWTNPASVAVLSAVGEAAALPQIATDGEGNAIAVWQSFTGVENQIQSSFRTPGSDGAWTNPASISTLSIVGKDANHAQVAVDSLGNAIAVWDVFDGVDYRIQASFRTSGSSGTWTAPESVPFLTPIGESFTFPFIAIGPLGDPFVVFAKQSSIIAANIGQAEKTTPIYWGTSKVEIQTREPSP